MQLSHLLGAGALIAAIGLLTAPNTPDIRRHSTDSTRSPEASSVGAQDSDIADLDAPLVPGTLVPGPLAIGNSPPAQPPEANGHYVLVVEGDRNGLAITFASKKAAPWAGVTKGLDSNWRLSVHDGQGVELANVPLDVRAFATDAQSVGQPARVQGCIVTESKIGMLVNVPAFATAQSYAFSRTNARGVTTALGTIASQTVVDLAGEAR